MLPAVSSSCRADTRDALYLLLLNKVSHPLDESCLVNAVRNVVNDDPCLSGVVFDLGMRTYHDTASARRISLTDSGCAEDSAACREIRSLDDGHELFNRYVRVLDHHDAAVDDFAKIMRRDVGRHTYGDTDTAVDQEVRETRRESDRLHLVLVEVRSEINGILVDVTYHLESNLIEPSLCITVCSRRISVQRTEVAVSVDQRMSQ